MRRLVSGFIPPYLLLKLTAKNPRERSYLRTLDLTHGLWLQGKNIVFPLSGKADRIIYDAEHGYSLPGTRARGESDKPHSDSIVNAAWEQAGAVRQFLKEVYNRNGIDGNGEDLIATVHYGSGYNNAFWNSYQMTFGDGDGYYFNTFVELTIFGHEVFHGVTERIAGLEYYKQSGALNEHVSDVNGVLIRQRLLGHTADKSDWLVAPGLWTARAKVGRGLRDMLHPGTAYDLGDGDKDPQPDHMDRYMDVDYDNGGVHYNSGIPNRAFALFALGCGGYAFEAPALVWFQTLGRVGRNCTFQEWADESVKVARANHPRAVGPLIDGWKQVGIKVE